MKKRIRKLIGAFMLIVALVVMQLPAFGSEAATTETKKTAEFVVDSEGLLTKYNGSSSSVVIPSNVVSIATDAFRDNAKITSTGRFCRYTGQYSQPMYDISLTIKSHLDLHSSCSSGTPLQFWSPPI